MRHELESVPNIGPAIAHTLERLGITRLERRADPCLLDTFGAAVEYADSGIARPCGS
jgi:hypothetical protein